MDIKQIGMIGVGSMGGMLTLLLAEHGVHTHFYDPDGANVDKLLSQASDTHHSDLITHHPDHGSLCRALESSNSDNTAKPKVFIFSIPHGGAADASISDLSPFLRRGDIIMDASNEHWQATERRQDALKSQKGVHYIGMGISGGYQSARHGPSISPGGPEEALEAVMPFLEKMATKDGNGRPCVKKIGPGGSGHYVKMVHNGIEHGMMTAFCEAWEILTTGLGIGYDEVGEIFKGWNTGRESGLRSNYLVGIGSQVCEMRRQKRGKPERSHGHHVLGEVKDKVVQDVDNSEGTGTWAAEEGIRLHVVHPTIAVSHLFRVASADAAKRENVARAVGGGVLPGKINGIVDKKKFVQVDVQQAVYAAFLLSFIQGMHILSSASRENGWNLNFVDVLQVWRAGCIIQSDAIVDLLQSVYEKGEQEDRDNLLASREVARELQRVLPGLKTVVWRAIEADLHVPALSASLEYFKYCGSTRLPTQFEEAELDYFGAHMFDLQSEGPGKPETGSHHFEWKEAKGIKET